MNFDDFLESNPFPLLIRKWLLSGPQRGKYLVVQHHSGVYTANHEQMSRMMKPQYIMINNEEQYKHN